jgi:hypothetical protein
LTLEYIGVPISAFLDVDLSEECLSWRRPHRLRPATERMEVAYPYFREMIWTIMSEIERELL